MPSEPSEKLFTDMVVIRRSPLKINYFLEALN
jgi:hypothetical protein